MRFGPLQWVTRSARGVAEPLHKSRFTLHKSLHVRASSSDRDTSTHADRHLSLYHSSRHVSLNFCPTR